MSAPQMNERPNCQGGKAERTRLTLLPLQRIFVKQIQLEQNLKLEDDHVKRKTIISKLLNYSKVSIRSVQRKEGTYTLHQTGQQTGNRELLSEKKRKFVACSRYNCNATNFVKSEIDLGPRAALEGKTYQGATKMLFNDDDQSARLSQDSSSAKTNSRVGTILRRCSHALMDDFDFEPIDCLGNYQRDAVDQAQEKSFKSQNDLQKWDRSMGLKTCYCRTMTKSAQSRDILKKLRDDFTQVFPPLSQADYNEIAFLIT